MPAATSPEPVGLETKLAFLRRPDSYPERPHRVEVIETHMSWVFLTEGRAYKLKKPVRRERLDFSTLALRRHHCAAEIRLNPRLAPAVYLGLVALTIDPAGTLYLDGPGPAIEWLVVMRRLPPERMLDRALQQGTATRAEIEAVATLLAEFYRDATPIETAADDYRRHLAAEIAETRLRLLDAGAGLPRPLVDRVLRRLTTGFETGAGEIGKRAVARRIVEAHGDLRPEHVFLGPPPQVSDCLEFCRDLRLLDPADELAFLAMECDRQGAPWVGDLLFAAYAQVTGDRPPPSLVAFYKRLRATIRARLAIMHLLDLDVRQPDHWRRQALDYLNWADAAG